MDRRSRSALVLLPDYLKGRGMQALTRAGKLLAKMRLGKKERRQWKDSGLHNPGAGGIGIAGVKL
jgi:hypothetical protein